MAGCLAAPCTAPTSWAPACPGTLRAPIPAPRQTPTPSLPHCSPQPQSSPIPSPTAAPSPPPRTTCLLSANKFILLLHYTSRSCCVPLPPVLEAALQRVGSGAGWAESVPAKGQLSSAGVQWQAVATRQEWGPCRAGDVTEGSSAGPLLWRLPGLDHAPCPGARGHRPLGGGGGGISEC